ncbi:hypothetical protein pipiens_017281, partial [Culex pipiens pipiens]
QHHLKDIAAQPNRDFRNVTLIGRFARWGSGQLQFTSIGFGNLWSYRFTLLGKYHGIDDRRWNLR